MCIRDRLSDLGLSTQRDGSLKFDDKVFLEAINKDPNAAQAVSYTHLRAHETVLDLVCRLLLEKKKRNQTSNT